MSVIPRIPRIFKITATVPGMGELTSYSLDTDMTAFFYLSCYYLFCEYQIAILRVV